MRCNEFQERWQRLLDERKLPENDYLLRAHAELCDDCDGLLQTQTVLFRELDRMSRSIQPAKPAVMSNAEAPAGTGGRSHARAARTRAWFIGMAIAASLLVLLIPSMRQVLRRDRLQRSPHLAVVGNRPMGHAALVVKGPSGRSSDAFPQNGGSQKPADQEAFRKLMQDVAAKLSDVPEEQLEPLDRIAGGFKPLANTLGVAWDALLRTIPVKRNQSVHDPQAIIGWSAFQAQA